MDTYTIYLVNQSSSTQIFWCFLERPQELASNHNVFANSSVQLAIGSNQPGTNTFTIPVQYVVGAGASNNAVGLNVQINSSIPKDANLTDTWEADYATVPPPQGPTMRKLSKQSPANTIAIASNAFDQATNEDAGWFSNMSFGIKTSQGFIGMTWSPSPQQTTTLTPQLKFYVAVGSYGSNTLADWTTVGNDSAEISVPDDFQYNATTVTYTATGGWTVTPGKPQLVASAGHSIASLIQSHQSLSKAHADLVALASGLTPNHLALLSEASGSSQQDQIEKVVWHRSYSELDTGNIVLSGTLTVATALAAAFTYFVLIGVTFSINGSTAGATTFNFTYSGTLSAQAVQALFAPGSNITLGG